MTYPHLHFHTEASLLDGLRPVETAVELAAKHRQVKALAITDHGTIAGVPNFVKACQMFGVKPIVGLEAYFTPNARVKDKTQRWFGHITLLAKNKVGYVNLIRLVTESNEADNFYYKPRIDWNMLREHNEGIIALTGCPGGILPKAIEAGIGEDVLETLEGIFGDDLYAEVQYTDLADPKMNAQIRDLAKELDIRVVATNDAHYVLPEDADIHPLLVAIATKQRLSDPNRFKIESRELYLKDEQEMMRCGERDGLSRQQVIAELQVAHDIADNIEEYSIERETQYPVPPRWKGQDADVVLRGLVEQGLSSKGHANNSDYRERVEYELDIIKSKGFSRYFLVLADLYEWIHQNSIVAGPGRGSAAASLVLYLLGVTGLDPMQFPVMRFERFLNPSRTDEPDVDCDIASHQRDQVIAYLEETYGANRVAKLGTFSTYAAKALLNDMARALDCDSERVNIDVLPSVWNAYINELAQARLFGEEKPTPADPTLKVFLDEVDKRLANLENRTGYPARRAFYAIAGQVRHLGTHAAGVVLTDEPMNEIAPVVRVSDNYVVGYTASTNRSIYVKTGLLKLDILGLRTLESLSYMVGEERIHWDEVDYNADDVLRQYRDGNTVGVFQFESSTGIRDYTMRLKPTRFADIYTAIALWRPGPLNTGMSEKFIELKQKGPRKIHPVVDKILEDSLGMLIFQEDLIRLFSTIASCSAGEADMFRRDLIKQLADTSHRTRMRQHEQNWYAGCKKNGISDAITKRLWQEMVSFARYGFNVPHAISYAAIGYLQMFYKARHPAEFIAATLGPSFEQGRAQAAIVEADRLSVKIEPPHVLYSEEQPAVQNGKVWLHLSAIKGLGPKGVESILKTRKKEPYSSVQDFRERVNKRAVNSTTFRNMLLIGSFDGMEGLDETLKAEGLFRAQVGSDVNMLEVLGVLLNTTIPKGAAEFIKEKSGVKSGERIVGGVITEIKPHRTRAGQRMGFITLIDPHGDQWEALLWPSLWPHVEEMANLGDPILVRGQQDEMPNKVLVSVFAALTDDGQIKASVKQKNRWEK